METLEPAVLLSSFRTLVVQLRSVEGVSGVGESRASVLAALTDSFGEFPIAVTATPDGLQFGRADPTSTDTPPSLLWPLDELIDDVELSDWATRPLAVDLSELRHDADFYRTQYGVDVEHLYENYRRLWNGWANHQSRVMEAVELFDALAELELSGASKQHGLQLAAWRLQVPNRGIDTYLARRKAVMQSITARSPASVLRDDDEDHEDEKARSIRLGVETGHQLHYYFDDLGNQSGQVPFPRFRVNLFEGNDLPTGAHVRTRILADIRPRITQYISGRWGPDETWSLTMSPALLIGDSADASSDQLLRDLVAMRNMVAEWPELVSATDAVLESAGDEALSRLERLLSATLDNLNSALPPETTAGAVDVGIPEPVTLTTKFRDRMRARTAVPNPLARFRDRRRLAAAAAREATAVATEGGVQNPAEQESLVVDDALPVAVVGLDERQRSIAEADPSARLVVVAGAGQGKTEVVAARLGHLANEHDLSLSTEVLVLSFSRAAVSAVRKRLQTRVLACAEITDLRFLREPRDHRRRRRSEGELRRPNRTRDTIAVGQ